MNLVKQEAQDKIELRIGQTPKDTLMSKLLMSTNKHENESILGNMRVEYEMTEGK
jgi:hypothetical protein